MTENKTNDEMVCEYCDGIIGQSEPFQANYLVDNTQPAPVKKDHCTIQNVGTGSWRRMTKNKDCKECVYAHCEKEHFRILLNPMIFPSLLACLKKVTLLM